jgi:uncharacterized repeat protein (TIGR01451 family)
MANLKTIAIGTVLALSIVSIPAAQALAWHPEGKIVKKVQNVTSKSDLSDANDAGSAVAAKPGDILNYVITVSNAQTNDDGKNDMVNTILKDTLPEGVELVSNPSARTITENLGTLKPKQSVTKEYQVKVTASTNVTITNQACFTGNTAVNDNPQQGCDNAVVTLTVPKEEPKPETPVTTTPKTPTTPQTKTETPAASTPVAENLPQTGPASTIIVGLVAVAAGYILRMKYLARQEN